MMHQQINELRHALVEHHLATLRDIETRPPQFRCSVRVLSSLLAADALRDLELCPQSVTTPLQVTMVRRLVQRIAIIPILRAGLGMVEPLTEMIPEAEVWHLGLYRDESTAKPVHYYDKLPQSNPPAVAIVADPMLATGGSAIMAVDALKRWGASTIKVLSIIAAPEGISALTSRYPDVAIHTCVVDQGLNERKYIVPGLGDAGDRIFNT